MINLSLEVFQGIFIPTLLFFISIAVISIVIQRICKSFLGPILAIIFIVWFLVNPTAYMDTVTAVLQMAFYFLIDVINV